MQQRAIVVGIVLLCVAVSAGCIGGLHRSAIPPSIVPVETEDAWQQCTCSFPFEQTVHEITVSIDPAVYYGAKEADKLLYLRNDLTREEWLPIYYLAFIDDAHQDAFYHALIAELRAIRAEASLDGDRYLELCTVFVQSIPYEDDAPHVAPKFPIETFADGGGDCDDKSLLLAALLAREGYNASLLFFEGEQHMAVGVQCDGPGFRDAGYAYIETTNVTYIGVPPQHLVGGIELGSDPLVIPVGDGTLGYGRCAETAALESALDICRERLAVLEEEAGASYQKLQALEEELDALRTEMDALSRAGRVSEYNRLVPEYNRHVSAYNRVRDAYNGIIGESRRYAGIHNYIVSHAHDRAGTYAWLIEQGQL
ncbi:MAG: hypothetical protein KO206_02480 [Methanomicrobiaceae archaeon]|nr:hypothetical protein [Methanomicrobiaceae archaeon]MDD5419601.1 hypothetical protein [Methanomicrobiaceae archaeon]